MRHRRNGLKLGRTSSHRKAMFRNMVTSLLKHDKIRTTDTKAKEVRRWVDHVITLAKRGDLHARRQVLAIVREKQVVHRLFENAVDRFSGMNGGYTRIVKLGRRPGDAAPMSMIELVVGSPKKAEPKKIPVEPKETAAPLAEKEATETSEVAGESAEVATKAAEAESVKEDESAASDSEEPDKTKDA